MTIDPKAMAAVARAIYAAHGYELDDPWDEAVERHKRLGLKEPSGQQKACLKAADAAITAYEAAKGEATSSCTHSPPSQPGIVVGTEASGMTFGEATRTEIAQVEPVAWQCRCTLTDLNDEWSACVGQNLELIKRTGLGEDNLPYILRPLYAHPAPAPGLDPATVEALDRILGMTSAITSDLDADQVNISWHRELAVRLAALRALLKGGANG